MPTNVPYTAQRQVGTCRLSHRAGTSPATTAASTASPITPRPVTSGAARARFASSTTPATSADEDEPDAPGRRFGGGGGRVELLGLGGQVGRRPVAVLARPDGQRRHRRRVRGPRDGAQRDAVPGDGVAVVDGRVQLHGQACGELAAAAADRLRGRVGRRGAGAVRPGAAAGTVAATRAHSCSASTRSGGRPQVRPPVPGPPTRSRHRPPPAAPRRPSPAPARRGPRRPSPTPTPTGPPWRGRRPRRPWRR